MSPNPYENYREFPDRLSNPELASLDDILVPLNEQLSVPVRRLVDIVSKKLIDPLGNPLPLNRPSELSVARAYLAQLKKRIPLGDSTLDDFPESVLQPGFSYLDYHSSIIQLGGFVKAFETIINQAENAGGVNREHTRLSQIEEFDEFDKPKRFLLTPEVNGTGDEQRWTIEQVSEFDREKIIQEFINFFIIKLTRALPDYIPYFPFDFKNMKEYIETATGQFDPISVENVIDQLGGDNNERIDDFFGAISFFFQSSYQRQAERTQFDTLDQFLKNPNHFVNKFTLSTLMSPEIGGMEMRPIGIGVTLPELLRFALCAIILRGQAGAEDFTITTTSGRVLTHNDFKNKPSPFFPGDKNNVKMNVSSAQITALLRKEIKEREGEVPQDEIDLLRERRLQMGADPSIADNELVSDEYIARVASAVFKLAVNMCEVFFMRAIHDHGAVRFDEKDASTLLHFAAVELKKIIRHINERRQGTWGKLAVHEYILLFFEAIWQPQLLRYRFDVPYLFISDDSPDPVVKIGNYNARMIEAFSMTQHCPSFPTFSSSSITNQGITKSQEILNDLGTNISLFDDEQEYTPLLLKKMISGDVVLTRSQLATYGILVPDYDANVAPFDRCSPLLSLSEIINLSYPNHPGTIETDDIDHSRTMEKMLRDLKIDFDKLVHKQKALGNHKYVDFNQSLADELMKPMRSACYYWAGDRAGKKINSHAEYLEARKNYPEPTIRPRETQQDFALRHRIWETDYKPLGIPLRVFVRTKEGEVLPDDNGRPVVEYGYYYIDDFLVLEQGEYLRLMADNHEMFKNTKVFFNNDFARLTLDHEQVFGDSRDQIMTLQLLMMEKVLLANLQEYAHQHRSEWTWEKTSAFMEMVSEGQWTRSRKGILGLIEAKKTGWKGLTYAGTFDHYTGFGFFTPDEALDMLLATFNVFDLERLPENVAKDKH